MRRFDNRNGDKIIKTVCEYERTGIRKRRLRLKTEMHSKTFDRWIEHLINLKILARDDQRYINLTEAAKIERKKTGTIVIPEDNQKNNKTFATKNKVNENENQRTITKRKDKAYAILISQAAFGDDRYVPMSNPHYGDVGMIDIKTMKIANYSGYHIPGVGISDFKKKEKEGVQSTLDRRRHTGYSELFAYIDFTKEEIQQYIDELKNHNPPIIKEIAIAQGERRYVIIDPLLKEFIAICWNIFGDVNLRMKETYVYRLWPKEKVGQNKSRSIEVMDMDGKSSTIYKSYMKWYSLLFGKYRFIRSHFSRLLRKRKAFEGLCRFKKYLEKLLRKKDLMYCSRDDIINSHNKVIERQQERLKHAKNLINSCDSNISTSYRILMKEESKYSIIRHKYRDVVKHLLNIIYPIFLRKLYEKQKILTQR